MDYSFPEIKKFSGFGCIRIPDLFACMNSKMVFHDWNADFYCEDVLTSRKTGKASDCIHCGGCESICRSGNC